MKRLKPIAIYVGLAYFFSWLIFIPLALNHARLAFLFPDDAAHARQQDLWHVPGGLGPALAALITLLLFYKKETRQWFLNGYSLKKLRAKSWVLSFSPLLIFAISLVVSRIVQQQWFDIPGFFRSNHLNHPANLLLWLLPIIYYGFGEEAGWRGYALPALQSRYPAFKSTVILSLIWICWHIPSFFYRYNLKGMAYLGFVLGIFAGAVWLTFLFNYTKGSILAVSLWHLTFNAVSMMGKDDVVLSATMSVMVMLLAVFVLLKYRLEDLAPAEKITFEKSLYSWNPPGQLTTGHTKVVTGQSEMKDS
jgi:membrane protease YdiL (CAAX protease family)